MSIRLLHIELYELKRDSPQENIPQNGKIKFSYSLLLSAVGDVLAG